ncbi:MAP7 domain-containing protein 3 isoform X2 [Erythrolamprus reginae]|uniref:MAP7 domain-containing protein 3 isoform X2 n=1 Tax=Erythrolamprus reginae TaxID=121349 RepID=UPI00396C5633
MAEGSGGGAPPGVPTPPASTLKGLREQMVAAAQALAEERRNQGGGSNVSLQSPISTKGKPVLDGSLLKSDERQRLARERREEREKQHAAKESQILEKEKKAKLQYERQIEEKQRRLKEQKLKEQQRRAAVEQKRKKKIEEEKVHYEAVVHRTLERSQRLDTRQKRWSWSGSVTDTSGKAEAPAVAEASKRSSSALNLKQPETPLHKRLSSSAAFLTVPGAGATKRSSSLNRLSNKSSEQGLPNALQVEQKGEPEKKRSSSLSRVSNKLPEVENAQKEARRLENTSVSRLLAPTQASLARSKSAATLSAEGKDPPASASSPTHLPKVPLRSRSTERLKGAASPSEPLSESAQKPEPAKQPPSSTGRRAPSPSLPSSRRSASPANVGKFSPSPSTTRRKPQPSLPNASRQRQPSPMGASKPAPIQRPPLTPNVLSITKKKSDPESGASPQEPGASTLPSEKELPAGPSKTKEDSPASFAFLPELPPCVFSPSSPAGPSFCSRDASPSSSLGRRMLFGYDPMSRLGGSSHSLNDANPGPSRPDFPGRSASPCIFPPCVPSTTNLGSPVSAKGFPSNLGMDASRHGDASRLSPVQCISFQYPHRSSSPYRLSSPTPFYRRSPVHRPMTVTSDPYVLNKLLHTFQTMRCGVDNISQELRVLNTHLANLSYHFGALPIPDYSSPNDQDDSD